MMFRDRTDAGKQLAAELAALGLADPVVLALPRGGVPVAAEIARALGAPLDVVIVRKIGAPGEPELALGALVDGNPPDVVFNAAVIQSCGLSEADLARLVARGRAEIERRRQVFGAAQHVPIAGKTAIVVDDGVATGATAKAAIRALRRRSPREIVIAVPVAPRGSASELAAAADRLVCLDRPERFLALSFHFRDFPQLTDQEVMAILREFGHPSEDSR